MNYTLKQLQYFVAACEEESVKRAAEKMNISQPSISGAIAHLEAVFGVQLFIRHHAKGLSLTPSGRRLLARANQLIKQAEGLHQYATDLAQSLSGTLEIGCFVTLAPMIIPTLIKGFQEEFPNVEVRCREGDHEVLYQALQKGDIEVALVYDIGPEDSIEFQAIVNLPPYAILPPRHRFARQKRVSLHDLVVEPLVLLDLPHSRQYFERLFYELGLEPNVAHKTASPNMVRSLVANGLGYSLLNAKVGTDRALDGKKFISVPLRETYEPLRMGLAQVESLTLTRVANTFSLHCVREIAGLAV